MLHLTTLAALALLVAPQDDARAALERAAVARDTAVRLRYEASVTRARVLDWTGWIVEGTVLRERGERESGARFRIEAKIRQLRGDDERSVVLVRNGEHFAFIDHKQRFYTTGDEPLIGGEPSMLAYELLALFPVEPEVLLANGAPEFHGRETMAGEVCTVIGAELDGSTSHTWHLSTRDGLPRLWKTARAIGQGDSLRRRFAVRRIETGVELPSGAFTLDQPEGYTRGEPIPYRNPGAKTGPSPARLTTLTTTLDPVREYFNAAKEHTRLLALFAPT